MFDVSHGKRALFFLIDDAKVLKKSTQNRAFFDFFLIFLEMLKCKIIFCSKMPP